MKYYIIILLLCNLIIANAQDKQVEKSILGIQAGVLGIWGYNESGLSKNISLRSELGLEGGFWGGSIYPKTGIIAAPVINLEPRLYYNFSKRTSKSKSIEKNSGNFVSIKTRYVSDLFVISNYENFITESSLAFMPTWGIRRKIGKGINYEAGIGLGYQYTFAKRAGDPENYSNAIWNIHLRLGYSF